MRQIDNQWAAMFMEEPKFFYEGFDTGGTSTGDTGEVLTPGTLIQDRVGNVWKAYSVNGAQWLEIQNRVQFTGTGRRSLSAVISQVGPYFMTETGRGLEAKPDGTFRGLAQYEGENVFPQFGGGSPGSNNVDPNSPSVLRMQADLMEEQAQNEFNRTLKLQKIQEAAALRASALSMENDLRTAAMNRQQEAESELVDLAGKDPFRFGYARMGQRAPQNTPIDIFKGQLSQTANAPIPKFNPNASMDEITNNIRQMEQFTTQQPFRPPGLEKGGKIGPKGAVEPFKFGRPDPHTMIEMADKMGMTPIITGERSGGPELMLAPKGTTVIPLTDEEEREFVGELPGAAFGGTVGSAYGEQIGGEAFRNIGNEFTPTFAAGSDPRLRRLFRSTRDLMASRGLGGTGFKDINTALNEALKRREFRGLNAGPAYNLILGALQKESGSVYGLKQSPALQFLRSAAGAKGQIQMGLRDIPQGTARYAQFSGGFGLNPSPAPGAAYTTPKPGQAFTGRIYSPVTGDLPSPHKIAYSFQQLDAADQALVLSAYELAGYPKEAFLEQIRGIGIKGGFRSGISV